METSGWITMVLILGFVWGGFGLLLIQALRNEKRKGASGSR